MASDRTIPPRMPATMPGMAGTLKKAMTRMIRGGMKAQKEMENSARIMSWIRRMRPPSEPCAELPIKSEITRVMRSVGSVVHIMAPTWSNRLLPETAGARFVVSERGESLSPK